ncbi:MAG: TetR/AcrR family transcriptional regulator [Bacteroidota bacterium]
MTKSERTKEFIVEKAAPIFNTKGYAGTSLADLITATGLTKGALYGNFENKDAIAIAVYEHNIKMARQRLDEYVNAQTTPTAKLLAITEYYRNNWKKIQERGGCPYLNASVEADDNVPFLKSHVRASIVGWAARIAAIIDDGKKSGEFNLDISSDQYAYTIITLIEGSIMLFKIASDPGHLYAGLDRIVKIINEEICKTI